jgi:hypothetical protein
MKILALLLLAATTVSNQEPLWYPFGPWPRPVDGEAAAAIRARLERKGGIALAVQRVCAGLCASMSVEAQVASNFLVERAPEAYPALLDAMIKKDKATISEARANCRCSFEATVRFGVCNGYISRLGGDLMDAHPLAVARRAGARQALTKAIAGGGPRAHMAMRVLLDAGNSARGPCPGLADAVQTATPVLVQWLGVPKPPLRIPGGIHSSAKRWAHALRALSFGGANRSLAEKAVRAFLASDTTAPLAAIALARMGVDMAAEVPHLARILDEIALGETRQDPALSLEQLGLLVDTMDALAAIGKPARVALPNVAAFARRMEIPRCNTLGARSYIQLVRAIATEADADQAAAVFAALLGCEGSSEPLVQALLGFGPTARASVVQVLRDDARPIQHRLAAADVLMRMAPMTLEARDENVVALLRAKAKGTASELDRCRAEAHLPPIPTPTVSPPPEFMTCLSRYLCGPAPEAYQQTIARCCRSFDPDICVGIRDISAPADAKAPPPP